MKKYLIKSISIFILFILGISINSTLVYASNSINLNKNTIYLTVINDSKINGKKYKNTFKLYSTNSKEKIQWISGNNNIATVDSNGNVTAKASGTTTIYAKVNNITKAECKVNVVFNPNYKSMPRFNRNALYSTVWPITDINIYKESSLKNRIGTIPRVTDGRLTEALIIETNNVNNADYFKFKIRTAKGIEGWVDPQNLLINLPDVRSDITYKITNATSNAGSIFKIGSPNENISQIKAGTKYTKGYVKLPEITHNKLYTYDNYDADQSDGKVWNSKLGRYEFVCPVIFKFALMIGAAQNRAIQNGYNLKIYDGYRPQSVCVKFWNKGLEAIGCNMNSDGSAKYVGGAASMKKYSSRTESQKKASSLTGGYWTEALGNSQIPVVYVNGNAMNISWFIASSKGISDHSRGTAVDLSMEYKENSKEITAQSSMHDLSLNSLTIYNNSQSNMLRKIMMTDPNMKSLISEWWHFNMAPTGLYAKEQVKFTNLKEFTTAFKVISTENNSYTVRISANRPLKKIPDGWRYLYNCDNRMIQKTYSSKESAPKTVTITDYMNREKKINIK